MLSLKSGLSHLISIVLGLTVGLTLLGIRKQQRGIRSVVHDFTHAGPVKQALHTETDALDQALHDTAGSANQALHVDLADSARDWQQPPLKPEDEFAESDDDGSRSRQAHPQEIHPQKADPREAHPLETTDIPAITGSPSLLNYRPQDHPVIQAAKKVKCRHRWTKYLDQQEPRPSSKLETVLRRYTRLHDKHLRNVSFEDALRLPLHSRSNNIRYLVWVPDSAGGLAGQMLSLVSSFLFALLTDRVLLVDLPAEIEHALCEPFPNSSWLLPEHIRDSLLVSLPKALMAVKQRQPMRSAKLHLQRGNAMDDKHLLTCHGTLKNVFGHIQWLVVQADYSFIETIAANRAHQNQIMQLFAKESEMADTVYAVLHRFLLHPSNFVWEKITSQYHVYFSDQDPKPLRIAMHPTNLGGQQKHTEALSKVIAFHDHWVPGLRKTSVYAVPFEYGTSWMDQSSVQQEDYHILEAIYLGTSSSIYKNPSPFINNWRKFLTDIWMTSWSQHYIIPADLPTSAVPGLLFRNRKEGVWLLSDQLDQTKFNAPAQLQSLNATADLIDCTLIKSR